MMKKGVNYVLAALVFIITMLLISGSGFLLSFGAALFGVMAVRMDRIWSMNI